MTPTSTLNETSLATSVGTLQLQEFDNNLSRCANFCGGENVNATHLVVLGLTCHCFRDLYSFLCEEEVGELVTNVYCVEKKPEQDSVETEIAEEVVLSWREPLDRLPKSSLYEMESLNVWETTPSITTNATLSSDADDLVTTSSTVTIETSAILVGVLLIAAVMLLVGFGFKTCIEIKRQKNSEIRKRLQESNDTFTSVSIS